MSAIPANSRQGRAGAPLIARKCTIGKSGASLAVNRMNYLKRAYIVLSCLWAVAIPVAAWTVANAHQPPAVASALTAYAIGVVICHQLPWRSFQLWGVQLPVCARCTGIYAASALMAAAARWLPPARQPAARNALILSALPTAATLAYEWTTGIAPSNIVRAIAGAPIGAAVAWVVVRL
jgi:uncharacterized membrane protein